MNQELTPVQNVILIVLMAAYPHSLVMDQIMTDLSPEILVQKVESGLNELISMNMVETARVEWGLHENVPAWSISTFGRFYLRNVLVRAIKEQYGKPKA